MKKLCKHCGSENVVKDAWAKWDESLSEWVLDDIFDYEFCKDCDDETTIIDDESDFDETNSDKYSKVK